MRTFPVVIAMVVACLDTAQAQMSAHSWKQSGARAAFLTVNQADTWAFDAEKNDIVVATVDSNEFDPVLELLQVNSANEVVLLSIDDPGNRSGFSKRITSRGKYMVRVRAFRNQGGGNYNIDLQRFQATPITAGVRATGAFNSDGQAYHFLSGIKDQIIVPELLGSSDVDSKEKNVWMLDSKGVSVNDWRGCFRIDRNDEYTLVLKGDPKDRYDLKVHLANQKDLPFETPFQGELKRNELDVWHIRGKAHDLVLLEIDKEGEIQPHFSVVPPEIASDGTEVGRLDSSTEETKIEPTFLSLGPRPNRIQYAVILNHTGIHELRLRASTDAKYNLIAKKPSIPLAAGKPQTGRLSLGGAAFFSFEGRSAQLMQFVVQSNQFVPVVTLYGETGDKIASTTPSNTLSECQLN